MIIFNKNMQFSELNIFPKLLNLKARLNNYLFSYRNRYLAVAWCLLAAMLFSITMTMAKLLDNRVSTTNIIFIRILTGLLFFLPVFFKGGVVKLKTHKLKWHSIRAILVSVAMLCTYYTYTHLPLALATAIGFSGPLITILISSVLLREKIGSLAWLVVFIGYLGILIVIQPVNLAWESAIVVGLIGNAFSSGAVLTAKYLAKTESTTQIVFYTSVINFMLIGLISFYQHEMPVLNELPLLCILGILGVSSQFCAVKSLCHATPAFLAPYEYLRLLFMIPLGFLLFNEMPSMNILFGSAIIVGSIAYLTFSKETESVTKNLEPKFR